jgi:hypothetical protein
LYFFCNPPTSSWRLTSYSNTKSFQQTAIARQGQTERLFNELSSGGMVEMPLNETIRGAYLE